MTIATSLTVAPPRREDGSARRQRVIDAAAALFARGGYHGVGTREIAESLGVKVSSLYFHVASKERALEEVCARGLVSSLLSIHSAMAASQEMPTRLRLFFAALRIELVTHSDYIAVYMHERRHLPPAAIARLDVTIWEFRAEARRLFEEARQHNELHASLSSRAAAVLMIGSVRNLAQFYVDGARDFDSLATDLTEAFVRAVSP